MNLFTRIRKVSCQAVYGISCRPFHEKKRNSLLNCIWHYKMILRLAGVFGFVPMTLLLNKFARPCC